MGRLSTDRCTRHLHTSNARFLGRDSKTDWTVLTEVAWSLEKIPDKRSIEPLYELDRKLQAIRDPENLTLKKLKEAVFWSIKQCDTWDQYS
ncbi:MAG: hypothetical protein CV089_12000 [Nitrospira sp. WS110]|nr:hypothetical protein [Nitrospira sp. WS110]